MAAMNLALAPRFGLVRRNIGEAMADAVEEDEATLLLRVAQRDRGAFAILFERVAPRVKGYLLRLGSPVAAAEELTQEVMLTVWRKADQYDPAKAGALTWLFVIARNRRIDSLRRERADVLYEEPPEQPDEDALAPDEYVIGAEREARVRAAIGDLPPDQQEVVRRSFFEDEPHAAIAESLGLPLGTVKSRLRLAIAKLRGAGLEDIA